MIVQSADVNTFTTTQPLMVDSLQVGLITIDYQVQRYIDMRNSDNQVTYILDCKQSYFVPNSVTFDPGTTHVQAYTDYPALLTNAVEINNQNDVVKTVQLVDFSPQTINTAVTSNQNTGSSDTNSNSQQHSSGSSTTDTNSFQASVSVGFGASKTGAKSTRSANTSESGGYSTSRSNTQSSSDSAGTSESIGTNSSSGSNVSIKDWGCFCQVDGSSTMPTWIWGQQYPWNLIDFRNVDGEQNIILPSYVQDRLYDGETLYPPSELSVMGVNFKTSASWQIVLEDGVTDTSNLAFEHTLTVIKASHGLNGEGELDASLRNIGTASVTVSGINLASLALDPLVSEGGPALQGFVPGHFLVAPESSGSQFTCVSEDNTLLTQGDGFTGTSQTAFMTTSFEAGDVSLATSFKIIDSASDISLSLKHWVAGGESVTLTVTVNGTTTFTRHIDAPEAGSGGDNVTTVPLRKKDLSSVDYCDYLQYGLNTIQVDLAPTTSGGACDYTLMALAIG